VKRRTKVVLEIKWDDTESEHPSNWDWSYLLWYGLPAEDEAAKLLDFEDFDDKGNLIA
jgi:hypothetical protein